MSRLPNVGIDASAALAFAFEDEPLHAPAVTWISELAARKGVLWAPPLFLYECDSIIRRRVFVGQADESRAGEWRRIVMALGVQIEHDPAISQRAYEIARDFGQVRVYDSTYAAFCEARGIELVTTDKPFWDTVNGTKKPKSVAALKFVRLLGAEAKN